MYILYMLISRIMFVKARVLDAVDPGFCYYNYVKAPVYIRGPTVIFNTDFQYWLILAHSHYSKIQCILFSRQHTTQVFINWPISEPTFVIQVWYVNMTGCQLCCLGAWSHNWHVKITSTCDPACIWDWASIVLVLWQCMHPACFRGPTYVQVRACKFLYSRIYGILR